MQMDNPLIKTIKYKNKWKGSYETLGFDTKDKDLGLDEYAVNPKGGYYIRTKPKNEAQFESVDFEYDVSKLKEVKIKGHAYYTEFRKADGVTERIQIDSDGYWNLSKIKAYPQPERFEMVSEIPIFAEDEIKIDQHHSIAHDSSTNSGIKGSVSSFTWSHTCTGSDITLLVGVSDYDITTADRPVTSVTYNGDALTKVDEIDNDGLNILSSLWYRFSPDTGGSYTISVTLGGTCFDSVGGATSLTGTDTTSLGASNKAEDSGDASLTVTTTEDNSWVHDVIATNDRDLPVEGGSQTERWNVAASIDNFSCAGSTQVQATAGDTDMDWDLDFSNGYAIVAVEIKEGAAGPTEVDVEKTLAYEVIADIDVEKTLAYTVITDTDVNKTLAYEVVSNTDVSKTLAYTIITDTDVNKGLDYEVDTSKTYTREANIALPADDTNLTTGYSNQDYTDVETDNDVYVDQEAINDQYVLHQFKIKNTNNTDSIVISIKLKTDRAPSTDTVYLQIYNQTAEEWETIDSDSTTGADTEFELSDTVNSSVEDYYTGEYEVSCRVYQKE